VVYGSVALIVKMDDLGLLMSSKGRLSVTRSLGRGIVKIMPSLLRWLMVIGTAAMLWVGGSIIIHGLEEMGFGWLGHQIHDWSSAVGHMVPEAWTGFAEWTAKATMDGVFGVALGVLIIPLATWVIGPIWEAVFKGKA
ncbi:MAG: DUF808 family protein, partial [Paracoccaceae bacterium]|nr:DUF808 family protein [Paracoccaceae bacterium]